MTTLLTALYLVLGVASLAVGWWSDRLSLRHDESKVRRLFMAGGLALVAVSIFGISQARSSTELVAYLMLFGIAFSPGGSQCYALAQMYAGRRASGPFVGVMNGVGNISGIVGPILTGVLVDHYGYQPAFFVAVAIAAAGALWWWFALPTVRPLFDNEAS